MRRHLLEPSSKRCIIFLGAALLFATVVATASAAPAITEFSSGAGPQDGAAGPDGNTWFVESGANGVARVTPSGGLVEYSSGISTSAGLAGIVAGPDGNLWFTESARNAIGQITPTGTVTEFPIPGGGDHKPSGITAGPDGRLWFTETTGNRIGAITTAGVVSEYSANLSSASNPDGITAGPDGNLWFTEHTGPGRIGRITTGGTITEFAPAMTAGQPTGITAGPDGNLWFTESANPGAIGRMSTSGALTEFTGGALTHDGAPTDIVAGDDGNLYFTENHAPGELGQITPAGVITEFTTNLTNAPLGITTGGDGNVWFTEATGNQVGRLSIGPGASTSAPAAINPTDATLAASVAPNGQATSYSFDWGLTATYGSTTSMASAGNGTSPTAVSAAIAGLSPSTTYHYRVVATNASGTTTGADVTFVTPALTPTALTGPASAISQTTATLSAGVNANGAATTYHFDVGTTSSYGAAWPTSEAAVGADNADHTVMTAVTGLAPGTTYHYRVVATNSTGVSYGTDQTFVTLFSPVTSGPTLPPVTRPLLGRSATIATAAGSVAVELPGTDSYIPLDRASTVPVGTTIDARAGTVRLTNVRDRTGKLQTATFWGGRFVVHQARLGQTATVIALSAPACTKSRTLASVSRKAPRALHLWAHDNHGRFVTRGHSAVATVRGTTWLTRESCAGTFVKVSRGVVSVRDLVRHRTVLVHAGQSYLARLR
jgi:streptogramin lyase